MRSPALQRRRDRLSLLPERTHAFATSLMLDRSPAVANALSLKPASGTGITGPRVSGRYIWRGWPGCSGARRDRVRRDRSRGRPTRPWPHGASAPDHAAPASRRRNPQVRRYPRADNGPSRREAADRSHRAARSRPIRRLRHAASLHRRRSCIGRSDRAARCPPRSPPRRAEDFPCCRDRRDPRSCPLLRIRTDGSFASRWRSAVRNAGRRGACRVARGHGAEPAEKPRRSARADMRSGRQSLRCSSLSLRHQSCRTGTELFRRIEKTDLLIETRSEIDELPVLDHGGEVAAAAQHANVGDRILFHDDDVRELSGQDLSHLPFETDRKGTVPRARDDRLHRGIATVIDEDLQLA